MGNRKKQAVRQALLNRSSSHHIASRVVLRAKGDITVDENGNLRWTNQNWLPAAIAQLMQVLVIPAVYARALISEHCTEKTRM